MACGLCWISQCNMDIFFPLFVISWVSKRRQKMGYWKGKAILLIPKIVAGYATGHVYPRVTNKELALRGIEE